MSTAWPPPGQQLRLSQGARATLERIVGNNANDVQALNRLIKGAGDWNRQRLTRLFGPRKAEAIINVVGNELTMARTNNIVQQGPETAARIAGKEELGGVNVNIPTSANLQGLGLAGASKALNALLWLNNARVNARIADLLTTTLRDLSPTDQAALARALGPEAMGLLPGRVRPVPSQSTARGRSK